MIFDFVEKFCDKHDVDKPSLPWKRKAPRSLEIGSSEGHHSTSEQEHYHQIYFEVLDFVTTGITDHFDQPGYTLYTNVLKAS